MEQIWKEMMKECIHMNIIALPIVLWQNTFFLLLHFGISKELLKIYWIFIVVLMVMSTLFLESFLHLEMNSDLDIIIKKQEPTHKQLVQHGFYRCILLIFIVFLQWKGVFLYGLIQLFFIIVTPFHKNLEYCFHYTEMQRNFIHKLQCILAKQSDNIL